MSDTLLSITVYHSVLWFGRVCLRVSHALLIDADGITLNKVLYSHCYFVIVMLCALKGRFWDFYRAMHYSA